MNWFKKQLNKLFLNDREDDEEYYEDEIHEDTDHSIKTNEKIEHTESKRSSFRFPLIEDYELDETPLQNDFGQEVNEPRNNKNITDYYYQKNAISKVYDVEVSGIRELLENRQRNSNKGKSTPINYNSTIRRVEKKEEPIKSVTKRVSPASEMKKDSITPSVNKRRFVPTNVPSPVHGFRKPSNINELLTKKQESEQKPAESNDEETKSISANNQQQQTNNKILKEVLQSSQEVASTVQIESQTEGQKTEHVQTNVVLLEEQPKHHTIIEIVQEHEEQTIESVVKQQSAREILEELKVQNNQHIVGKIEQVKSDEEHKYQSELPEMTKVQIEKNDQQADQQEQIEVERQEVTEEIQVHPEITVSDRVAELQAPASEIFKKPISIEIEDVVDSKENEIEIIEEFYEQVEDFPILVEEIETSTENEQNENTASDDTHKSHSTEDGDNNNSQKEITVEQDKEKKRGALPFNVLMLKSDKEKYAAKLAQKQPIQHNDVIKELSRHSNSMKTNTIEQINLPNSHVISSLPTSEVKTEQNEEIQSDLQLAINNEEQKDRNDENQNELPEPIEEVEEKKPIKIYVKPSFEFLSPPEEKTEDRDWMESQADVLVEALSHFQVTAQVESIMQGPAVTQFEITVGHGTKVSKIRNLADDLKLALAAKDIRIQAPIPGKSSIGIEIPNRISRAVRLSEVTNSESFTESESPLEAALGLDLTGKPVTIDLRKMPHGLIAGATGSGKSVCINSILVSLLYKAAPHELKLMLIDPKMVELAPFNHIPHLVSPVITDVKAATAALKWAVEEMERRYQLFAHAGVRDLPRFNKLAESNGDYGHKLPYILIVIDELADLMMMSPADVEEAICRIAQKARACGIHLIVATQRPSVDVITGLIKSNIPTRIAFAVSSQVDSRTILDNQGAERLLGRGDMLYLGNGMSAPIRLQGTFVTDDEIEEIIEHVRAQGEPDYVFEQDELLKKTEMIEEQDELFEEVCRFVYEQGTASTSSIQRKYHIGYNRAARLIDLLESQGFISEQRGSKPREVYITDTDLSNMFD
ncbi:DNA translocase FtsK [Ureibacillus xyleni]|uniref:DNA translocase FtsK n=1 Tax=Ureibacillus xyleni TaxID=614648 RepID=A0A285S7A9_9BACL|nr:DNA translocase FtsK [Ureibacillus xyleni]SOC03394.1 DNA translocase FtsK [Ureibacillus xyleni]